MRGLIADKDKKVKVVTNDPKTWDIWYAYIPKMEDGIESHSQNGWRPVLIISNNLGNNSSTEVNIFSLSKNVNKLNKVPVHVLLEKNQENGLIYDSIVLCEAVDTIPKSCLQYKMGAIQKKEDRNRICLAARRQMGIFEYGIA